MKNGRILVAVDESEIASTAVVAAADLAARLRGELALVTVVDPRDAAAVDGGPPADEMLRLLRDEAERTLKAAANDAAACPPTHRFLREGHPGPEVCASAREWGADMIVIGSHGRGGLTRLLMGSTAEAVMRHAPCPVLVIPASSCAAH
ncbi:MAG: universal stress protein [Phycisphaerales bacterium]